MTLDAETALTVVVVLGDGLGACHRDISRPPDYTEAQRARTRAAAEKLATCWALWSLE